MVSVARLAGQVLFVLSLLFITGSSFAIDIVINVEDKGMNPAFDEDGDILENMFSVAATLWEDYLPESGTFPLDVWWTSDLPPDIAGEWNERLFDDDYIHINTAPGVPWFIDDTPEDSSEFDFVTQYRPVGPYLGGQWLYRDLDSVDQSDWLSGSPPGALEIGYLGWEVDPAGPTHMKLDLLTIVLHELGHALGINADGAPWSANPIWVDGISGVGFTEIQNEDGTHLLADVALVSNYDRHSSRVLPSAVDIMAVASAQGMTVIDLPRQDFWGGTYWTTPSNWEGNSVPDADDDAYVRHGGSATLSGTAGHVENLVVDEGSTVEVFSGSTLVVDSRLTVGKTTSGTTSLVDVSASQLGTQSAVIGENAGSVGRIRIGSTSTWGNTAEVHIGASGDGTLAIEGGTFSASDVYLGYESTGIGRLDLSGGSSQANIGQLEVGYHGFGMLDIGSGAAIVAGGCMIGRTGGTGHVTVDGTLMASDLRVGSSGSGTLIVRNGGDVSSQNGRLGYSTSGTGEVTVDGTGSTWTVDSNLTVGMNGHGTLTITGGGHVSNWIGYVGSAGSSSPGSGTATVHGAGSTWTNNSDLYVGRNGGVGTLTITSGGQVTNENGYLGAGVDSTGTATVDGAGSTWTNDSLYIGGTSTAAGGTGMLEVTQGGAVTVANTTKLWSGGALYLDGGSVSTGSFDKTSGGTFNFSDGTLTVDGGTFEPGTTAFTLNGATAADNPTLVITNSATTQGITGNLVVGDSRRGTLTISAGAAVSNDSGKVGNLSGSTGTVNVDGAGSTWTNNGNLYVGTSGMGMLTITGGGTVVTDEFYLGNDGTFSATGGTLRVNELTGPGWGSAVSIGGNLEIGHSGGSGAGSYAIGSGESLDVGGSLVVGYDAPATFTQTGGTNTVSSSLSVSGRYELSDGELSCHNENVSGTFDHAGGTNTIGSRLTVYGAYDVSDGLLSSTVEEVWGTLSQTGGRNSVLLGLNVYGGTYELDGGRLNTGSTEVSFATFMHLNGTHTVDGDLSLGHYGLQGGGTYELRGGVLSVGGTTDVFGESPCAFLQSGGTHEVPGILIRSYQGVTSSYHLTAGVLSAGNICTISDWAAPGNFSFTGGILHVSTFEGDLHNEGGVLAPGSSIGTTTVTGDYTQDSGAALQIQIGGVNSGEFDQLIVNGRPTLAGTLQVVFTDLGSGLFAPDAGDVFEILHSTPSPPPPTPIIGMFDELLFPDLVGDLEWTILYDPFSVLLVVSLPGDYNLNGVVDAADYTVWRDMLGQSVDRGCGGDGNFDGQVTEADYEVWKSHFGKTAGAGASLARNLAVPEPLSALLLLLGCAIAKGFARCSRLRYKSLL